MKRIIGLAMVVLAVAGIVNVICNSSQSGATPATGNSAYDTGRNAGKKTAPFVMVGIGLAGLWLLFQPDGEMTPASAPWRRSGSPDAMPTPGSPVLRGGQNTFASNPALLRLNTGRWLAANPVVTLVASGVALTGLVFMFIKLPVGIVLLLAALIFTARHVRHAKQKFFMGDVCPAVVLYSQLDLVAVFTDLKAGANNPRPAVKILKQPLRRLTGEPASDGMRLAAVALYYGNVRQAAWQDFSPEVVPCVVQDPEENARVLASIPEQDWQALDAGLAQVSEAQPGLYRLWGANQTPDAPPAQTNFVPAKPWFKTGPVIVGFSIFGALIVLVGGLQILGMALRRSSHAHALPPPVSPAPRMNTPFRGDPTQSGPFAVNGLVQANWAGGWIPGKITAINPGGFSLMVQLDDKRFPFPIVLSTNQVRLK